MQISCKNQDNSLLGPVICLLSPFLSLPLNCSVSTTACRLGFPYSLVTGSCLSFGQWEALAGEKMVRREKKTGYFYCPRCVLGRAPFSMVQSSTGEPLSIPTGQPWILGSNNTTSSHCSSNSKGSSGFLLLIPGLPLFTLLAFQLCQHLFLTSPLY